MSDDLNEQSLENALVEIRKFIKKTKVLKVETLIIPPTPGLTTDERRAFIELCWKIAKAS